MTESHDDELFRDAVVLGTPDALEAWADQGPKSVARLRDELSDQRRVSIPSGTSQRLVLDNLIAAAATVAGRYPDEFLESFSDREWDSIVEVCAGLGEIHTTRATLRLMKLLRTGSRWVRIHAAAALRGHQHRGLRSVLIMALDDPDELVHYHVTERLAEIDDSPESGTGDASGE